MVFRSRFVSFTTGEGYDVLERPFRRIMFANADVDWETMVIPPDCERVPNAGVVAGSPDAVVAGASTERRFRPRQTANACLVPTVTPVTLSLSRSTNGGGDSTIPSLAISQEGSFRG